MEIIGYGILLAIGFYVAPIILNLIVVGVVGIFVGISYLFGGRK